MQDGLRPKQKYSRYPPEWTHPERFDPKSDQLTRGEEELIERSMMADDPDGQPDAQEPDDGGTGQDKEMDTAYTSDGDETPFVISNRANDAAAQAVLRAGIVNQIRGRASPMVWRPVTRGNHNSWVKVHKATVCKWINSNNGREKLSADRGKRVTQGLADQSGTKALQQDFDVAADGWVVKMYDDVACLFGNNCVPGKIVRVRRRVNKRWTVYTKPVVLHDDRTPLGDLWFTCYWYTRQQGRAPIFEFKKASTSEVHVMTLVCPVRMTCLANGRFLLPPEQHKIMKKNLAGHYYWDPDEQKRKRKTPEQKGPVPTMEPTHRKKAGSTRKRRKATVAPAVHPRRRKAPTATKRTAARNPSQRRYLTRAAEKAAATHKPPPKAKTRPGKR